MTRRIISIILAITSFAFAHFAGMEVGHDVRSWSLDMGLAVAGLALTCVTLWRGRAS